MGQQWDTVERLAKRIAYMRQARCSNVPLRIVMTSMPGDPLHAGHIHCLQKAKKFNDDILVVLVDDDDFLVSKKGYYFLPFEHRIAVINSIAGVDYTVKSTNHPEAIRLIKPTEWYKDGDRTLLTMDVKEIEACKDAGTDIVIGGNPKSGSSSNFFEQATKMKSDNYWYLQNKIHNPDKTLEQFKMEASKWHKPH